MIFKIIITLIILADEQLNSGMLKQHDYDQLLQRLEVLDRLKKDKE